MKRLILSGLLLSSAAVAAPAPRAPTFDVQRISRDIRTLASDAFEGRGPATPAEAKSIAYIAEQMKAAGLQPAGDKGSWYQDVPLLKSDIVGTPQLSITSAGTKQTLTQGDQIAVRAALTGQQSVAIANAPLVFVGYGVKAPERNWDDFKGVDLKGKIMVVLINDPDFDGGEGDFGGKAMTYYGRWTYKYEEAARQGAAGILIVHESAPASYGWATVRNSNTNTMFDIVRKDPTASHVPMEAWIQRDLAVELFKRSGLDFDAAKAAARKADFRAVPLKATLDARYSVKPEVITSRNVAGVLPGTKHPAETVIYSAHWDHLGVGQPDAKGDRIYNGALDNASGVAALLELARAYGTGPKPDRSVLFLAVTAEEKGLLGSEYYAANPLRPLATTAGVINMDGPFGAAATRNFSMYGMAKLDLLTLLTESAAAQGRRYTPDARPEAGLFYRSDHFSFAKRGVPALSYSPGRDLVVGGEARGKELVDAYTRDKYHQPADEYDPNWDTGSVQSDMTILYTLGRRLADGRAWPNWSNDSEFRAARDATAAARGK
ncbi:MULTISPECIES: M28 family metallopeptidase [unclassified Sphingomonas]|uniref:M28 family metallopeptidase n=1 Tax=unclassified Sphingomonas TaxID=196159 RepID=UPI0006F52B3A|nr:MULTISPECIES: M28 family metallopeptidase [unclassified Sphingomonas]KQM63157.1 peptidase M20 [Sphingomonas sp. Leaf16]KQN14953.1 peptidase M20 [Sphingomonas sp. Leaf29]KQN20531.1 peptidase M20 [Sphingomonas sp. Leaf32]